MASEADYRQTLRRLSAIEDAAPPPPKENDIGAFLSRTSLPKLAEAVKEDVSSVFGAIKGLIS
jgi:hypothetical protein